MTHAPGSRRVLAVLALLAGWAFLAVAGATPALAHAVVVGTDPADSSRLDAVPATVTVTFSEEVSINAGYVRVVDSSGDQVSEGDATGTGRTVSVRLRAGLEDGSYLVSYRIVSADSHPITGAYAFVVGDGPLVAASGAVVGGTSDRVVDTVFKITRWMSFAGIVLFGGLAFLVLCWPAGRTVARARRLVWTGWGMATAGAVAGLLLEGPYAAGTGLADVVDGDLLRTTLGTTYGRMLCGRLVLLGALAVLAVRLLDAGDADRTADPADPDDPDAEEVPDKGRARDEDLAAICVLGVLATYGGVGHAAAGSTPTLALLSDTTHLAAAMLWIGGLAMLAGVLLPAGRTGELARALPRFSSLALGAVGVLLVTGTYQAWREVGPLPALWSTEYGKLLLAKIVGFVLLVGLGYFSRQAVQRRYVRPVVHALSVTEAPGPAAADPGPADRDQRRLRTSVAIEVVIATVVLMVTAVLVQTAPAKATYVDPVSSTVRLASGGSARVEISPARVGVNTIRVTVLDAQGAPADAAQVTATLGLPAEQIGPLPVALTRAGTGQYTTGSASMPRPGTWEFVLRVQMSEFDRDVAQVDVPVT